MNGNTGGSGPRGRWPLRRLGVQAAAVAAVALLAAACGGGGGSGGGSSGRGGSTTYQKELAFSQCMRAHGEPNYPDPGSNGVISIQGAPKGSSGTSDRTIGGAQMTRASNACRHLLPNGGVPTAAQKQQMLKQGLKFAECMRAHGVPNFPDPPTGGGPTTIGGGIKIQSPQFQSAQRICQKDVRGHSGNGEIQIAG